MGLKLLLFALHPVLKHISELNSKLLQIRYPCAAHSIVASAAVTPAGSNSGTERGTFPWEIPPLQMEMQRKPSIEQQRRPVARTS